jgi:pimeloyl-ACP methyl ester carboxylesterase
MFRKWLWVGLIAILTLTSIGVAAAQEAGDPGGDSNGATGAAGTFEATPCFFAVPSSVIEGDDVICGYVTVPEDHGDPDGPAIRLAVVVAKDHSAAHQDDPVMLLAGGPGEKIVTNALLLAQVLQPIARNRDLIVFDQRGAGLSKPALECPEFIDTAFDLLTEPDHAVVAESTFNALMACRDRLAAESINFNAYNTTQNAADVGMIRQALGYEEVNLFGGSYGSLLAQATMRDHPDGIRSVVIDSVLPMEISLAIHGSFTATGAMIKLLDSCAADAACNTAYPDLQGVLFEVIDRLNADPVPMVLTSPLDSQQYDALLTGDSVLGNLFIFLYETQVIPVLPQAIYDVYTGDYTLMTQLSSLSLARYGGLTTGMELSVMCTDDLIGYTPDDLRAVMDELPPQLVGDVDFDTVVEYSWFGLCAHWPVDEADPSVREPVVSDIPTLVLAGEFDPVTPPEYAELVAGHLSNAHLFEFPGVGHSVTVSNACAQRIVAAFYQNPAAAPNASCIDDLPGLLFDLPVEDAEIVLEPFTNTRSGISGVRPTGWEQVDPTHYVRGQSGIDQTQLVIDSVPLSAEDLLVRLSTQLRFEPDEIGPATSAEIGQFTWDMYAFELRGYAFDLAIAEAVGLSLTNDGSRAYFVLLISDVAERDRLYETLFVPVLEALGSSR